MTTAERPAHLARLARLALTADELEQFSKQSDDILKYMDILAEVDTTDVEPLYNPLQQFVSRADVAEVRNLHAAVLGNAPESNGDFFIVPRIV